MMSHSTIVTLSIPTRTPVPISSAWMMMRRGAGAHPFEIILGKRAGKESYKKRSSILTLWILIFILFILWFTPAFIHSFIHPFPAPFNLTFYSLFLEGEELWWWLETIQGKLGHSLRFTRGERKEGRSRKKEKVSESENDSSSTPILGNKYGFGICIKFSLVVAHSIPFFRSKF